MLGEEWSLMNQHIFIEYLLIVATLNADTPYVEAYEIPPQEP